jgi:hypothetical protein
MKVIAGKSEEKELPVVSPDPVPVISDGSELGANAEKGPTLILPGGGKMLRWPDGRETGPVGGELLRQCLLKGAEIVGEVPIPTRQTLGIWAQRRQIDKSRSLNR